jgi:glutathione synthase/RimK-type ligase-like ATP-grasp enzyme
MKQILLLGSLSFQDGEHQAVVAMVTYVTTALTLAGEQVKVSHCYMDHLGFVIGNDQTIVVDLPNNKDIRSYDLVFFRGKLAQSMNAAGLVGRYLTEHHVPFTNSTYAASRTVGKLAQMYQLAHIQLPVPKTVSAGADYLPQCIEDHLSYPVIVKDEHGSHGRNNYLVKSKDQLLHILAQQPDVPFIAQEYIVSDGDYRVLLVGSHELIIRRQATGDTHLNNTSQGGTATRVDSDTFPTEIIEASRRFAADCQYEVAGVDVVIDSKTGKYYFLEINSQPQLASGAFVDEKRDLFGQYIKQLLEGEPSQSA